MTATKPEFELLAARLNAEDQDRLFSRRAGAFVRVMNEAARRWPEIERAGCTSEFMGKLFFLKGLADATDKWGRLRAWALIPVVIDFADRQAWRGWSVWREMSKIVKAKGDAFVRAKFATGEWGPDLRREQLDAIVGNARRHRKPKS